MVSVARRIGLAAALVVGAGACTGKRPSEDAPATKRTEPLESAESPEASERIAAPRPRTPIRYECRAEALEGPETGYTFELGGTATDAPITSLAGTPERPSAGDVVSIARVNMVLGPPGHYEYRLVDNSRLELSVDGGPYKVVGVRTESTLAQEKVDFSAFSRAELRGIRGLLLPSPIESAAPSHLESGEVVLTFVRGLGGLAAFDNPEPPPISLPAGLRYLRLEAGPSDVVAALRTLGEEELRYLVLELRGGASDTPFDARELAGFARLEYLQVRALSGMLTHPEALGSLTGLRSLDLFDQGSLTSIEFVRGLHQLRRLDVRGTGITSLEPLAGHPSLEVVLADHSPVVTLPSVPPPSLRRLSLTGTSVADETAAAFAQRARGARVDRHFAQVLADVTSCATRVRVRTGGLCHRRPEHERTLFEITEPAAIRESLELFTVSDEGSGFWCMCCGNPTVEFYRGEELVAEVGFHHGKSLRWSGWSGDVLVADEVIGDLCRWMESHGAEAACEGRDRGAASTTE